MKNSMLRYFDKVKLLKCHFEKKKKKKKKKVKLKTSSQNDVVFASNINSLHLPK
jgi:hypothetical protein